jgi:hypothetical protein
MAQWNVDDREAFLANETRALYDHGVPEPIIACHRLKVLIALEDELRAAPDAAWAETACAAVNRYLNTTSVPRAPKLTMPAALIALDTRENRRDGRPSAGAVSRQYASRTAAPRLRASTHADHCLHGFVGGSPRVDRSILIETDRFVSSVNHGLVGLRTPR